jgi:hypothetical protein
MFYFRLNVREFVTKKKHLKSKIVRDVPQENEM